MNKEKRIEIFTRLRDNNPTPTTELNYSTPFELLIAVILSAQATDVGVNKATDKLYPVANTPEAILALGVDGLKEYIKTIGLFNSKAENVIKTCRMLIEQHGSEVPEKREELTTEGGLDVDGQEERVARACERLARIGAEVSLFIDPDPVQIDAAVRCGAPVIELHTGEYAEATTPEQADASFRILADAVSYARKKGLIVNAGHGLHYHNTERVAAIPGINELNIGHAIVARAVFTGLKDAVKDMRAILDRARA